MTKEHIEKLINILGIDPKKGEWLTSAMAKSSFPESFSEGLYKHLADKKLDTYLEELEWLSRHLVSRGILVFLTLLLVPVIGLSLFSIYTGVNYYANLDWSNADVVFYMLLLMNLFIVIGVPTMLAYILNKLFKQRKEFIQRQAIVIKKFNEWLTSLPDHVIDEINQERLEADKTAHFLQ
ncbi:MAG: hypothetical protein CMD78_04065 [Gammaproteobacteria bacterium]|nr:hypothetical protein [Gammaproteobacteria bacterium]